MMPSSAVALPTGKTVSQWIPGPGPSNQLLLFCPEEEQVRGREEEPSKTVFSSRASGIPPEVMGWERLVSLLPLSSVTHGLTGPLPHCQLLVQLATLTGFWKSFQSRRRDCSKEGQFQNIVSTRDEMGDHCPLFLVPPLT